MFIKRMWQVRVKNHIYRANDALFCKRMKAFSGSVGFLPDIEYETSLNFFKVFDSNREFIYVPRKSRVRLHAEGVATRLALLKYEYLLDDICFRDGDVIIDVGANIGNMSLSLTQNYKLKVVAVEPDSMEVGAIKANLQEVESEIWDCPLWYESGEVDWYPANESGDSSIFKQFKNTRQERRKAMTLDELFKRSMILSNTEFVKLMKLEAEGAEPEILQGSTEILKRIEYIAADVGAERGMEKESTLIPVQKFLLSGGFEPIRFGLPRAVMLFRNRHITS